MKKPAHVYRVGLTGNIASGKSAVARVWQRLGAQIVDADELARRAVAPGSPGLAAIRRRFGDDVIAADGSLDRARMRAIVFADPERRAQLEHIVHPEVARLRADAETALAQAGESIVVHVIPLLFETGLDATVDTVVLVDAQSQGGAGVVVPDLHGIDPVPVRTLPGGEQVVDGGARAAPALAVVVAPRLAVPAALGMGRQPQPIDHGGNLGVVVAGGVIGHAASLPERSPVPAGRAAGRGRAVTGLPLRSVSR